LLAITLLIFEKIGVANLGLTIMQSICQAGAVGYIIMGWFGKKSIKA
jgi:phosphotransacetylase